MRICFGGLIASMYIGNVLLLIVNLPFVGVFASLLKTPMGVLMPIVATVVMVGAYVLEQSVFDLWLVVLFGALGFVMRLTRYEPAPLVIGLFLGPFLEKALAQSMVIVNGNPLALLARPFSGTLLAIALLIVIGMSAKALIGWLKQVEPPAEPTTPSS